MAGRATEMRRIVVGTALAIMLSAGLAAPAGAESLTEALASAYQNNPTLDAARAKLRATDEAVPQARAGARPTVGLSSNYGPGWTQTDTAFQNWYRANPSSVGIQVEQPLYRGGRIDAGISQAENQVLAERAVLHGTEQTVLLAAATAYLDVVRGQAVLDLNRNNEQVLKRRLDAERDRFRVGEITRTDVSQAESRLAKAVADRIQAEGNLSVARATYARVIGPLARSKTLAAPKLSYPLPGSLDETVALARDRNPSVVAALFGEKAAQDRIDAVEGQLLPTVSLKASASRANDRLLRNDFANSASLLAQVTIPIDSGAVAAQTREARQTASQKRIQILEARQQAEENAIRSWQSLTTARASIVSRQVQVKAAELALEGVRQEAAVGSRTVLDTLNAEQELLDARVSLVTADHDDGVAVFTLLAAIGQLTAQELRLSVPYYDYEAHYHAVRDKWFGLGIEE